MKLPSPPDLPIQEIWVYLSGSPLLALTVTLLAYQLGLWIYRRSDNNPLCNPTAIAVCLVAGFITVFHMPYEQYFAGAQFVHFLLGTATVSLAVPIARGFAQLRLRWLPLLVAMLTGGIVSIVTSVLWAQLLDLPDPLVKGLFAKSVTAPIGMGISERIGASPTITVVYAVLTGVMGSAIARYLLDAVSRWIRPMAWWERGFAVGNAAHGLGTSRAFSINAEAGAYASLAMGMHGIVGAVCIPWLARWWFAW